MLTVQVRRHNRLQEYETFIFSLKKEKKRRSHACISIRLSSATQEENFKKKEGKKDKGVVNAHWDATDLRAAIKEEQLCLLLISSDEHSAALLPFISAARLAGQPPAASGMKMRSNRRDSWMRAAALFVSLRTFG